MRPNSFYEDDIGPNDNYARAMAAKKREEDKNPDEVPVICDTCGQEVYDRDRYKHPPWLKVYNRHVNWRYSYALERRTTDICGPISLKDSDNWRDGITLMVREAAQRQKDREAT